MQVGSTVGATAAQTSFRLGSESAWRNDHLCLEELFVALRLSLKHRLAVIEASIHQSQNLMILLPELSNMVLNFDRSDVLLRTTLLVFLFA